MSNTITSEVRTYDPKKVIVTFGVLALSGYMDGTFITITPEGDAFEKHKGADGSIDRVNKNSYSYEVSLVLKQTAPANVSLAALKYADQASNKGILPLTIKDFSGMSLFTANAAWIRKEPNVEYGDSIAGREWIFDTGMALSTPGGNNQ
jgi:hypothetical protein